MSDVFVQPYLMRICIIVKYVQIRNKYVQIRVLEGKRPQSGGKTLPHPYLFRGSSPSSSTSRCPACVTSETDPLLHGHVLRSCPLSWGVWEAASYVCMVSVWSLIPRGVRWWAHLVCPVPCPFRITDLLPLRHTPTHTQCRQVHHRRVPAVVPPPKPAKGPRAM